jgi:hypothetical protein
MSRAIFREGDRVKYIGRAANMRYVRGTVVDLEGRDFHLAGVKCYAVTTVIELDGGHHTIRTDSPENEWLHLDAVEALAELNTG